MTEAADLAERVSFGRLFLEAPDEHHLREHVEQRLALKPFDRGVQMLLPLLMFGAQFGLINFVRAAFGDNACAGGCCAWPAWFQRFDFQFAHLDTLTDA